MWKSSQKSWKPAKNSRSIAGNTSKRHTKVKLWNEMLFVLSVPKCVGDALQCYQSNERLKTSLPYFLHETPDGPRTCRCIHACFNHRQLTTADCDNRACSNKKVVKVKNVHSSCRCTHARIFIFLCPVHFRQVRQMAGRRRTNHAQQMWVGIQFLAFVVFSRRARLLAASSSFFVPQRTVHFIASEQSVVQNKGHLLNNCYRSGLNPFEPDWWTLCWCVVLCCESFCRARFASVGFKRR